MERGMAFGEATMMFLKVLRIFGLGLIETEYITRIFVIFGYLQENIVKKYKQKVEYIQKKQKSKNIQRAQDRLFIQELYKNNNSTYKQIKCDYQFPKWHILLKKAKNKKILKLIYKIKLFLSYNYTSDYLCKNYYIKSIKMIFLAQYIAKNQKFQIRSEVEVQLILMLKKIEEKNYGEAETIFFNLNTGYPQICNLQTFDIKTQREINKQLREQIYKQLRKIRQLQVKIITQQCKQQSILSLLKHDYLQQSKNIAESHHMSEIYNLITQLEHYRQIKKTFFNRHNFDKTYKQEQYFNRIHYILNNNRNAIEQIDDRYNTILRGQLSGKNMILGEQFQDMEMEFRIKSFQRIVFMIKSKYRYDELFTNYFIRLLAQFDIKIIIKDQDRKYFQTLRDILAQMCRLYKHQLQKSNKDISINTDCEMNGQKSYKDVSTNTEMQINRHEQSIVLNQINSFEKSIKGFYDKIVYQESQILTEEEYSIDNMKKQLNRTKQTIASLLSTILSTKSKISNISSIIRPNETSSLQYDNLLSQNQQLKEKISSLKKQFYQNMKRQKQQTQRYTQTEQQFIELLKAKDKNIMELQEVIPIKQEKFKALMMELREESLRQMTISSQPKYQSECFRKPIFFNKSFIMTIDTKLPVKIMDTIKSQQKSYHDVKSTTLMQSFSSDDKIIDPLSIYDKLVKVESNVVYLIHLSNQSILLLYVESDQTHKVKFQEQQLKDLNMDNRGKKSQSQIRVNKTNMASFMMNLSVKKQILFLLDNQLRVQYDTRGLMFGNMDLIINLKDFEVSSSVGKRQSQFICLQVTEKNVKNLFKSGKMPRISFKKLQVHRLNY